MKEFCVPDIVCAFNCGFHEFAPGFSKGISSGDDTWGASLTSLVRTPGVPLIFSSYTKTEALKDLECIKQACADQNLEFLIAAQKNPYRSSRPIRDFEFDNDCDTFYNNQFYSLVRQEKK